MPVKLYSRSHPAHNAARMVYHTGHGPCGCQGIKELKDEVTVSKVSMSKVLKKSPKPRALGSQGMKGVRAQREPSFVYLCWVVRIVGLQ